MEQSEESLKLRRNQRKKTHWYLIFIFGVHRHTCFETQEILLQSLGTLIDSEILARKYILTGLFFVRCSLPHRLRCFIKVGLQVSLLNVYATYLHSMLFFHILITSRFRKLPKYETVLQILLKFPRTLCLQKKPFRQFLFGWDNVLSLANNPLVAHYPH